MTHTFGATAPHRDRTPSARVRSAPSERSRHDEPRLALDELEPVLTIRERIPRSQRSAFVHDALEEIRVHLRERGIEIDGPPFVIAHATTTRDLDLEVGWPVRLPEGSGRISAGSMSTHLARPDRERSGEPHVDHVV